jgi:hypothetical protein
MSGLDALPFLVARIKWESLHVSRAALLTPEER